MPKLDSFATNSYVKVWFDFSKIPIFLRVFFRFFPFFSGFSPKGNIEYFGFQKTSVFFWFTEKPPHHKEHLDVLSEGPSTGSYTGTNLV
jgi:hypothetical protein